MTRWTKLAALVFAAVLSIGAAPAAVAAEPGHHTGQLADGATWVADVPAPWNGTIILYSHGFGPLAPQNAPDAETARQLLAEGYALVGSSYSGPSWWALESAVGDQFGALSALEAKIGPAKRTIAWGTSMGGLVSAREAEDPHRRIDGALTTCGLVAGALNLNAYQLHGEYALAHLLAPGQEIKLVRYGSQDEAAAAAAALTGVTSAAQATPAGRARIALAAALMNVPVWYTGATAPAPGDYETQEAHQEQALSGFVLGFVMTGRRQIELAAGGNSAATRGTDYRALLGSSTHARQVRELYRRAGLDLDADLAKLGRDADITADPGAVAALARTSVPTGRLRVPALDVHTVADQLVPVEQENWYARQVASAGAGPLLRQAYVENTGHCAFAPAETIAGLHALETRITTGRWGTATAPEQLNAAAGTGRYTRVTVPRLVGAIGPGRG
ncbi:alpha/beta hydrolase [Amycolatopsis mongoliensis]|uniref:Alpha/beta hydrolase n=1 Tax=Amycolatopsis mongoliensis TaxID=715475 RepID=A0A9Y2JIV7_9PSEU|nr:alpha/beta hydrolase [Amycolatopsis sp. 4-36]WIX98867.1 alpha/beta hydrolase [Amycolatopsis sp. 4-36]